MHAGLDQRPGLVSVHQLEGIAIELEAHRAEVDGLAADHPRRPGGARQHGEHAQAQGGILRVVAFLGHGLEGQALQAVAGKDGAGLVLVGGGLAATQVVVVHGRQIVVHQRIGMDQLDRAGGAVGAGLVTIQCFAGGVDQQRADALATVHHAVAHGLVEPLELRQRRDEEGFEAAVDALLTAFLVVADHHASGSDSKGLPAGCRRVPAGSAPSARPGSAQPGSRGSGRCPVRSRSASLPATARRSPGVPPAVAARRGIVRNRGQLSCGPWREPVVGGESETGATLAKKRQWQPQVCPRDVYQPP